tara:strand:+ start:1290 stop:2474 length:1185 start_codon:yes stop_codon:yes gene_type:complete
MFAEKITEEQRVERAHVQIMRHKNYIFLTNILMMGTVEVVDADITACTDGKNVVYGRAFVASLTDPELVFLILHEAFHKMYRHLRTWKHLHDKSAKRANKACDYVINVQITDENRDGFATMPEGGLLDSRFKGMNAQEVFDILEEEEEEEEEGQGPSGGGDDTGETLDVHDWEGADERDEEEDKELERDIESALRQGSILAGQQGGNVSDEIGELLKPKIDWRKELRNFISQQCAGQDYASYAEPDRRFLSSGLIMPSPVAETIPELLVAMDTSGSCWDALPYFLAELKSICKSLKAVKVHVMFWDAAVEYELHEGSAAEDIVIKDAYGGGGTDVNCVSKYMRDNSIKPTAAIIMTDGYLSDGWGTWSCPMFWALVRNPKARPPVGKYVHVEDV